MTSRTDHIKTQLEQASGNIGATWRTAQTLLHSLKEFPNKMWKRRVVDYLIKKIDLDSTTARNPGSERPKYAQTAENVEIVSELICSQEDTPHSHSSPCAIA